ncbi:MAG: hypothetical protein ACJZ2K_06110 [Candidatus Poseidoniaceae archaeon]
MSQIRTFNVLTLTMILFLAGCFGMGDSAEAADDHEHTPNAAPVLETGFASIEECNGNICNASVYHAAVDPDGDLIDIGYDFDLDGTIDYTLIEYRGFTDLQIPVTEFETVATNTTEDVETSSCVNDQQLVSTTTTTNSELITTIALIAVDSNDAASAELITMRDPAVVTSSTTVTTTVECTTVTVWSFSHRDAAGDMSDNGEDALVHIQMTSGDALSWQRVKVSIVVDGGASKLCVEGGDATSDCTWDKDGDSIWGVAEEITISEGGDDLCSGEAPCNVVVTLTKIGVGEEADMVIASITATAENN